MLRVSLPPRAANCPPPPAPRRRASFHPAQPEKQIIIELIKNEEYKYVRALGAFYLRLTGKPIDIYQYLEPLYNDYRKLRFRSFEGYKVAPPPPPPPPPPPAPRQSRRVPPKLAFSWARTPLRPMVRR